MASNPTPIGPFVPQGIAGVLEEAGTAAYNADTLLEALQGDPALDPSLVQPVKDARNAIRSAGLNRDWINFNGGNGGPIP